MSAIGGFVKTWRRWHLGLSATIAGASLAVPGILAALGFRNLILLLGGAVITPLTSGATLVLRQRWERAVQHRDVLAVAVADGSIADSEGGLYRVRDFPDPIRLGVHPAPSWPSAARGKAGERVPPYVPRDIDGELRRLLTSAGFVLVTGDSTSGKSRAAYEAISAIVPDHRLIAPASRETLSSAIARMMWERRCVLWLDDIERFLGPAGLNRTGIARLTAGSGHHRLIVATLRASEMARYSDRSSGLDDMSRQLAREARETLEQAYVIPVNRLATSAERMRAEMYTNDPRIAGALAHADLYGIAEYLAAGPELLAIWQVAWEPSGSPRGAALVAAAIDCRRAGLTKPLPRVLLEELHSGYLARQGGNRLHPEELANAWNWATQPRSATTALLEGNAETGYIVFDYLVDAVQRKITPENLIPISTLTQSLLYADPAEAERIGWVAIMQSQGSVALKAFTQACEQLASNFGDEHLETLSSRRGFANALYHLGRWEEAEAELRAIADLCERTVGPAHNQSLASKNDLAYVLSDSGKDEEAEVLLNDLIRFKNIDNELRLSAWEGIAIVYANTDRYVESEAEFEGLIEATSKAFGSDHIYTLTRRCYRAMTLRNLGRLQEAETEQRAVLEALLRTAGPDHYVTLQSRANLGADLKEQGRFVEAEAEYDMLLESRIRALGRDHIATIQTHIYLTEIRVVLGRYAEAKANYALLVKDCLRIFGDEHSETRRVQTQFAELLQRIDNIEASKQEQSTGNGNNSGT